MPAAIVQQTQALSTLVSHLLSQQDGLSDLASAIGLTLGSRGVAKQEIPETSLLSPSNARRVQAYASLFASSAFFGRHARSDVDVSVPRKVWGLCRAEGGRLHHVVPGPHLRLPLGGRRCWGPGVHGPDPGGYGAGHFISGQVGSRIHHDVVGGCPCPAVPQQGAYCKPSVACVCPAESNRTEAAAHNHQPLPRTWPLRTNLWPNHVGLAILARPRRPPRQNEGRPCARCILRACLRVLRLRRLGFEDLKGSLMPPLRTGWALILSFPFLPGLVDFAGAFFVPGLPLQLS